MDASQQELAGEIERRRSFAIISHPDAGKTTLTEKLLLFGGALREAGAVRAQKASRYATSDWLELEKQRGISVSSSVMHFEHAGHRVNILDTPGHKDFSEDTYRTLLAADSAVMLIDAGKGVEAQTRKLFEVCRISGIPIFTFINKMDRLGRDPLELLSDIEEVLGIDAVPLDWPVGAGSEFRGVYDRQLQKLLLFSGGKHGTTLVEQTEIEGAIDTTAVRDAMGSAGPKCATPSSCSMAPARAFDPSRVRAGEQTPVFFGSALTNFGVLPFLERFLDIAPCPGARDSSAGTDRSGRVAFLGLRVQDPGEHGPRSSRPRRVFARVFGPLRQGRQCDSRANGQECSALEIVARAGARSRGRGHRLSGGRRRIVRPGDLSDR